MTLYNITFTSQFGPYQFGDVAGFAATKAVELFCAGYGALSDEDQATLAAEITAYQSQNPAQSPAVNPSTIGTNPY
jgi:hypothetical protein